MYAIVDINGSQYKAQKGDKLFVNRLPDKENSKVTFDRVLLIDNDGKVNVGTPEIKGATVSVKVVRHVKDDKVIVFRKKRRKGFQTKRGHRQALSEIVIEKISEKGGRATKEKKAKTENKKEEKPKSAKSAKPKAKKAEKPAAKKETKPKKTEKKADKPASKKSTSREKAKTAKKKTSGTKAKGKEKEADKKKAKAKSEGKTEKKQTKKSDTKKSGDKDKK